VDGEQVDPLEQLAQTARIVCFAGLPGTGKSFFGRKLAELGSARGRNIHLLQWDAVRPAFEASPSGRRYPMQAGVTHPMIRKAAGVWVRQAVLAWHELHPAEMNLLIGETPLVGNRFVELIRRHNDRSEALLASEVCVFAVPVPSAAVRRELEQARAKRSAADGHDLGGAAPAVLEAAWDELVEVSRKLGIPGTGAGTGSLPYDPVLYERVYRRILANRRRQVFHVDELDLVSVAAAGPPKFTMHPVVPTPDEAELTIRETEARYRRPVALEREMENWYVV